MRHSVAFRVGAYLRRRAWLAVTRLRHPRAHLGAETSIEAGFRLTMAPQAVVEIGPRCSFDRGVTLETSGLLRIGADTVVGHHSTIASRSSVVIGSDCLIAELVSIRDHDHGIECPEKPTRLQLEEVDPVTIGDNVWLGAKVTVLKGVSVGDGTVVGA